MYWANEEPAEKIKLRLIQSYFAVTRQELEDQKHELTQRYAREIAPYFRIMSAVGTSMEEADEFIKLNKPDIIFMDQLDKFRINGEYNRGDERLKETYVLAREIAKRNGASWAVSQASNDAQDVSLLICHDGRSKTGKAGEADIIIGIAKTGSSDVENTMRFLCISKNKPNGWHGAINTQIDVQKDILLMGFWICALWA